MNSNYVTDKAIALIKKLHNPPLGAKEFSGGWSKERCDAVLFAFAVSYLIETKISRADFLADAKKPFRQNPEDGIGNYRYYACPEGLIQPDELPPKWGLIWVRPNNKRALMPVGYGGSIKVGERKHPDHGWTEPICEHFGVNFTKKHEFYFESCKFAERQYIYALATRLKSGKFMENIL